MTAYWISFPEDENFPIGFGVTGHSLDDAYALLESRGFEFHLEAKVVHVAENIRPDDLDYKHVVLNSGPIVTRGVWYPFMNV